MQVSKDRARKKYNNKFAGWLTEKMFLDPPHSFKASKIKKKKKESKCDCQQFEKCFTIFVWILLLYVIVRYYIVQQIFLLFNFYKMYGWTWA